MRWLNRDVCFDSVHFLYTTTNSTINCRVSRLWNIAVLAHSCAYLIVWLWVWFRWRLIGAFGGGDLRSIRCLDRFYQNEWAFIWIPSPSRTYRYVDVIFCIVYWYYYYSNPRLSIGNDFRRFSWNKAKKQLRREYWSICDSSYCAIGPYRHSKSHRAVAIAVQMKNRLCFKVLEGEMERGQQFSQALRISRTWSDQRFHVWGVRGASPRLRGRGEAELWWLLSVAMAGIKR